jgi:hypothetical protein
MTCGAEATSVVALHQESAIQTCAYASAERVTISLRGWRALLMSRVAVL